MLSDNIDPDADGQCYPLMDNKINININVTAYFWQEKTRSWRV
jgi:hypothetical protein